MISSFLYPLKISAQTFIISAHEENGRQNNFKINQCDAYAKMNGTVRNMFKASHISN